MARQRLGQHFLYDAGWREEIAQAIGVKRRTQHPSAGQESPYCWLEIGAGHGEMTELLAASGVPILAVELDPPLLARLHKLAARLPNLTILPGDVLKIDLTAIAGGRRLRIYGNLPYYITSPILHRFFEAADRVDQIHIVIQWEVAARLVAAPGSRDYGYLSVLTQYFSRPSVQFKIPPEAFRPPPEVDSALVSMALPGEKQLLQIADDAEFLSFVKSCFAQKRKTLLNNLKGSLPPATIQSRLEAMELAPTVRAEELSIAQFADLHRRLLAAT